MSAREATLEVSTGSRTRTENIVGVMIFFAGFSVAGLAPLMPVLKETFAASSSQMGLLISAFGLVRFLSALPVGYLADRFNQVKLLILGNLGLILGGLMAGLAHSYQQVLVGRLITACGFSLVAVSSLAMLGSISSGGRTGKVMGRYYAWVFAGQAAAPALAGFLAAHTGWQGAFFMCSAAAALALLVLLFADRSPPPGDTPRSSSASTQPSGGGGSGFAPAPILGTLFFANFTALVLYAGGLVTFMPLYGAERLKLPVSAIGLMFGIASVATPFAMYFVGSISDRVSKSSIMMAGIGVFTLGNLLLLAPTAPTFFLAVMCYALGGGLFYSSPYALAADYTEPPPWARPWPSSARPTIPAGWRGRS